MPKDSPSTPSPAVNGRLDVFAGALKGLDAAQISALSDGFAGSLMQLSPAQLSLLAKFAESSRTLSPSQILTLASAHPPRADAGASAGPVRPSSTPSSPLHSATDLGALVRAARESAGLTQQGLADAAGVGRRFVSELENGKPTLEFDKALAVANAVGIDLLARKR